MLKDTCLGLVVQTHPEPDISSRLAQRINSTHYSVREVPSLTISVAVAGEIGEDTVIQELQPTDGGLKLNLASRGDGEYNHPLGVTVTGDDTREPAQFDHLQSDVVVFADPDSPIQVFDRGYLDYDRFCAMKRRGEDFVILLQSNARVDVLDTLQDVDISDETGTRHVSDQRIELAETPKQFRRIVFEDVDGEEI